MPNMDTNSVILTGILGLITAVVVAYLSSLFTRRAEQKKWKRDLGQKIAELKSSNAEQAEKLTMQFAVGYLRRETDTAENIDVYLPPAGRIAIGRFSKSDIVLEDSTISKNHAIITVMDSRVYLEDLNSRNGTYVNGRSLSAGEKRELFDGDVIRFAKRSHMVFRKLIDLGWADLGGDEIAAESSPGDE